MTRIGDLLLEHAAPSGPAKPWPVRFVHGMWGEAGIFVYMEAVGHAHMPMLEEGWGRAFGETLRWMDRATPEG